MVQVKYSVIKALQISLLSLSCLIADQDVGFTQASNVVSKLQRIITGQFTYFTTDKLQRIYAVSASNELKQFDSAGKQLFHYSNNTLGDLQYIDTSNPFNLLLFYPEFQTVVTLDRTLSPTAELNLLNTGIGEASAVALSNDNQLWIYDMASLQLKKLNARGEVLLSSGDLSLGLPSPPRPIQIVAGRDRVYLNDPGLGLIVFNNFGQYLQTIPLRGITFFQVFEQHLIYRTKKGQVFTYHLQSLLSNPIQLSKDQLRSDCINIQAGLFYMLGKEGIHIAQLEK